MVGPRFPKLSQHIAIAGRTGSGKSVAAIDMLSRRLAIPWWLIDHKHDKDNIAHLPGVRHSYIPIMMPKSGLHIFSPSLDGSDEDSVENLLAKIFKQGNCGTFVDEGHFMPKNSPGIRKIMIAGRSKNCPMMFCSQRAVDIDPFIWSQSTFFRVFALRTNLDIKRYEENVRDRFTSLPEFHSHYYDGTQDVVYQLGPSEPLENSIARIDNAVRKEYGRI